jgi:hypothetical protein
LILICSWNLKLVSKHIFYVKFIAQFTCVKMQLNIMIYLTFNLFWTETYAQLKKKCESSQTNAMETLSMRTQHKYVHWRKMWVFADYAMGMLSMHTQVCPKIWLKLYFDHLAYIGHRSLYNIIHSNVISRWIDLRSSVKHNSSLIKTRLTLHNQFYSCLNY